jgi:hypothetical protein
MPYDNSLKLRNSISYLDKEVISFLEDMFDGDNKVPNTEHMTATIDSMAQELGIYSDQWIPFHTKKNLDKFISCEGKARQLLAHMEVLSRMQNVGVLSEDNKNLLAIAGAGIKDSRTLIHMHEADVIANYHVRQILVLRQELIDILSSI